MSTISINPLSFYPHIHFFSPKSLHKLETTTTITTTTTIRTTTNILNNVTKLNCDLTEQYPCSSSFTVQYLVDSCGLPLKSAISASKRVQLVENKKTQYDSVVCFLKSNEFSDTHVAELVEKRPAVLSSSISATLEPKIRFLIENGVPGSIIPTIFVSCPIIFYRSVDAQLKPIMELLKYYVSSDEKIMVAIRSAWIFNCDVKNTLRPNVEFLIQQGVPKNRVGDLLAKHPRGLYRTSVERKVGVFKSMGWSYDEVISTFVHYPGCLILSEKKLRGAMDFLVNTAKTDPKIIIGNPLLLAYSLEKRMVPRYTIWKILKERHLIPDGKFVWVLTKSEKLFIDAYVTKFTAEIPHLRSIYDQSKMLGRLSA